MVGKTSTGLGNAGVELDPSGQLKGTAANVVVQYLNRTSSDGSILEFRKDNTTIGSISSNAGLLSINAVASSTGALSISGSNEYQWDTNTFYPVNNNSNDLGHSSYRWKDLYLSGGAYLGGTGSANHLDDYEEGTWTPGIATGTGSLSSAEGVYVKIGKLVNVRGVITIGTTLSANTVNGLPFAVVDDITGSAYGHNGSVLVDYDGVVTCVAVEGSDDITFYNNSNTGSSHTLSAGRVYRFTAVYHTSA